MKLLWSVHVQAPVKHWPRDLALCDQMNVTNTGDFNTVCGELGKFVYVSPSLFLYLPLSGATTNSFECKI